MRLELAELLRCPAGHAPTPLVVVARRVVDRELMEGYAGCPVCTLEARVSAGAVRFPPPHAVVLAADAVRAAGATEGAAGAAGTPEGDSGVAVVDDAMLERTIALLALAEAGGAVLLAGRYAPLAAALRARLDVATVVAETSGPVPMADGAFRAAALDLAPDAALDDALRTVQVGGRLLAPATAARPAGARELARDATEWVAEREAAARVVTLGRASPRTTSR